MRSIAALKVTFSDSTMPRGVCAGAKAPIQAAPAQAGRPASVAAGISGYGEFQSQIKEGKMRALAVSSPKRIPAAPDLATLKEQGINIELYNWRGVFGPPGINASQRAALTKKVTDTVRSAAWKETLKRNDWESVVMTGDQYTKFIASEVTRVGQVLKDVGLVK